MRQRLRIVVRGLVQGVGFRPFVKTHATQFGLTGLVGNDEHGVFIEAQGSNPTALLALLQGGAPKTAQIDSMTTQELPLCDDETQFQIVPSQESAAVQTRIGPDVVPCEACLSEVCDPSSRRYLYPFSSCCDCGPRLTIAHRLPYDRSHTTLALFPLCTACLAEYHDPQDRRFHAQPMACPVCGPRLSETLSSVVAALRAGQIVALKGVGGYHLLCDARRDDAVKNLRLRKQRDGKPLAVMVLSVESAKRFAKLSGAESAKLGDPRRPIVLLARREDAGIAASVASDLSTIGLVLPMSLLHYLLWFEWLGRPTEPQWWLADSDGALVATSGNLHDEPLICDDEEARQKLSPLCDLLVTHDRPIAIRCDDSVVRSIAGQTVFIRRARGYVPDPIPLPVEMPPALGLGGELKATFCLTRGREAFVSQHLGDLDSAATLSAYRETLFHFCRLLDVRPTLCIADMHPDFAARRIATELALPLFEVQHHAAHLHAVMAEQAMRGKALGLCLDGFGLGENGQAWGGELLFFDGQRVQRLGHLAPILQPGGDLGARQPWRLATAILANLQRPDEALRRFSARWPVSPLLRIVAQPRLCPSTTACGRYFQAAAALLGVCESESYEAEAAMRLESLVELPIVQENGYRVLAFEDGRPCQLDLSALWTMLLDCSPGQGAALFHGTLAHGLCALALPVLHRLGLRAIVLSGGCVMNRVFTESLCAAFSRHGIAVHLPVRLPPNDGGLSLGQVYAHALGLFAQRD